jgi:flagella basal body P-ring formation protein FlgA
MRIIGMLAALLVCVGASAAGAAGPSAMLPGGAPLTQQFTHDLLSAALAMVAPEEGFDLQLEQPRLPLANPLSSATAIAVEELHFDAANGRFSALLVGTVGDQVRFRLPAQGRVQGRIELPVLARPVAAGEAIAAEDVEWVRIAPDRLRPSTVTAAGQLVGSEARRALQAGRPLSERDLQPARLVARGRAVQLVYHRPGLELQALGIAQGDGALGALVRVINLDSRQQLQGVVIGPDRVALGGLPQAGGSASR